MNDERRELLRKWSAGVMGYFVVGTDNFGHLGCWKKEEYEGAEYDCFFTWTPDSPDAPASQILGVIEAMRELGWKLMLDITDKVYATFYQEVPPMMGNNKADAEAATLPEAVLEAAYATGVGR